MTRSGFRFAAFHQCGRFFLLAFLFIFPSTATTVAVQRRLPLDPLTSQEREAAARLAREDSRVKELLGGGRQGLVYVEFLALKPDDRSRSEEREGRPVRIGRYAEVLLYGYEKDQGARVVVNLERSTVQEVTRLEGDLVPITFDDLVEARAIALRNSELRVLLGADADRFQVQRQTTRADIQQPVVEGLRLRTTDPNDPCYKQRCLYMLFRRGRTYLNNASVIVNLNTQTVRIERRKR